MTEISQTEPQYLPHSISLPSTNLVLSLEVTEDMYDSETGELKCQPIRWRYSVDMIADDPSDENASDYMKIYQ